MVRSRLFVGLLLAAVLSSSALGLSVWARQEAPAQLDACQQAQAEALQFKAIVVELRQQNAELQAQLTQLQTPIAKQALEKQWIALEQELRAALKPAKDSVFDRATLTFKPKG